MTDCPCLDGVSPSLSVLLLYVTFSYLFLAPKPAFLPGAFGRRVEPLALLVFFTCWAIWPPPRYPSSPVPPISNASHPHSSCLRASSWASLGDRAPMPVSHRNCRMAGVALGSPNNRASGYTSPVAGLWLPASARLCRKVPRALVPARHSRSR